jgi:hypothetical protein
MLSFHLDDLPFLKSLCWQGDTPSIAHLSDAEILQLYERNWRYRGVIANLSEEEKTVVRQLALKYDSWLANEV